MSVESTIRRTEFTVSWPIQGIACFRSRESELVLSDVYWRWIFEVLSRANDEGRLAFVEAVEDGFGDASQLVETIPIEAKFLDLLRKIDPSRAPSFERVVPAEGTLLPTAEQILTEFERLVGEAVPFGSIEMEIE